MLDMNNSLLAHILMSKEHSIIYSAGLTLIQMNQIRLGTNMREATRNDRPVIGTIQTQCCICWKMFASDSICERQKPYARLPEDGGRGRVSARPQCINP